MSEQTYPGSTQPLRRPAAEVAARQEAQAADAWDVHPIVMPFKGVQTPFFSIGALSVALKRKSNTLREWEEAGHLPTARWRTPGRAPHGSQRLYSRAQVEGLIAIADDEGLFDHFKEPDAAGKRPVRRKVSETQFGPRAHDLWKKLKQVAP